MKIAKFCFNMFRVNCFVVWDTATAECMVVDPGMLTPAECEAIDGFIATRGLKVKHVVNTHLHLDHCFGNRHMEQTYGVTPLAHPADHHLGADLKGQARMFGLPDGDLSASDAFGPLVAGQVLTLGSGRIEVRHVPGHSPGGIALYIPDDKTVITGDAIFAGGGIGRTDLPGGNYSQLVNSISTELFTLPPETAVLPGHGPATTIGAEQR